MIKTQNKWFFADKPMEISVEELRNIQTNENEEWIATLKADGYRALIDFSDDIGIPWSRRDNASGGPVKHPTNQIIIDALEEFRIINNIPSGTRLDGEWCARRQGARSDDSTLSVGEEQIVIFGIYYLGDKWLGNMPEENRWKLVSNLIYNDHVRLAESTETEYIKLFEKSMTDYKYEGIVLKHKHSKLIADTNACKKNPMWLKVKWRGNDDGLTML